MSILPNNFLWGAATSAYQVEGAYNIDGKGLSVQDVKKIPDNTSDFKVAADHYHFYKEDVALFKELGLKTYRFSISWTRIIPDGDGEINPKGIEFYNNLINELIKNGIEPFVTVYHFDLPDALNKKGGWSNRSTIDAFVRYCDILFENFADRVKYWLTINEQNMMILHGNAVGTGVSSLKDLYQQNHHMLLAQARVMNHYHANYKNGMIGPAPNIAAIYPLSSNPKDVEAADTFEAIRNWLYLDMAVFGRYNHIAMSMLKKENAVPDMEEGDLEELASAECDFIAINYYSSNTIKEFPKGTVKEATKGDQQTANGQEGYYAGVSNPNLGFTEFGWQVDPLGFKTTLHRVYERYNKPIIVTENGLGGKDVLEADGSIHDDYRIEYLNNHINTMMDAVSEGVNVFGYCPWSAIDLISTHQGLRKRYGFIYVNREDFDLKDLKRYKKDSFYWYQNVIKNNGVK